MARLIRSGAGPADRMLEELDGESPTNPPTTATLYAYASAVPTDPLLGWFSWTEQEQARAVVVRDPTGRFVRYDRGTSQWLSDELRRRAERGYTVDDTPPAYFLQALDAAGRWHTIGRSGFVTLADAERALAEQLDQLRVLLGPAQYTTMRPENSHRIVEAGK